MGKARYLKAPIKEDLGKKMVFLGGPRQVGKTTLAKSLMTGRSSYFNWDLDLDRERILKNEIPIADLLVFDELHKNRKWRNWIKGIYDTRAPKQRILVTGSARLDLYRYGGDSLQGRYHYWRLHPLSVAELGIASQGDLETLFRLGPFPEPYFSQSAREAKRWSREYRSRVIRDDVTALETVSDLGALEQLGLRLPDLVGSSLSVNSLREDLRKNHETVQRWLEILERVYMIYRISPYGPPRVRAVKKEQKHYHFDWTLVPDEGARFENMVANHLLKWSQYREDHDGDDVEVRFYRDSAKREVDFVILVDRKPTHFIECKLGDQEVSDGLRYLHRKSPSALAVQISLRGKKDYLSKDGIRVMPALDFLKEFV